MALSRTTLVSAVSAEGLGTAALVSGSFTPPDYSLIVVVGGAMAGSAAADPSASLTMAGGGLTFTRQVFTGTGTDFGVGLAIWTAPVATGASMTLTLDCGAVSLHMGMISAVAYTGYDTVTPAGATGTGSATPGDGAQSITLSGAPASTSEVVAGIVFDKESVGCTPGSAFTEIHDLQIGAAGGLESQVRTGSTSTTVDWVDTHTGTGSIFKTAFLAVEIKAAGAAVDTAAAPVQLWPALIEKLGGRWPRPQTEIFESSVDTAPVNPDLVPQSSTRVAWVARRLRRPAQVVRGVPALPDMAPANTSPRRVRPKRGARSAQPPPVQALPPVDVEMGQRRRKAATVRSQSAQRVPDQVVTPPATPDFVSGAPTRRLRWAQRRSESAQPVLTQAAPPTNPPIVFLVRARRVLFGRRLSDVAEVPFEQVPPPAAAARASRRLSRVRRSESTAPTVDQPVVSAPLERRRFVVRRGSGRSATPTPTQQAAPQSPLLVALVHERVRRVFRRNVGHTASPVPAQQAAPQNPPFVFGIRRRVQPALRRGFGQVSSPITQATDFVVSSPGRVRRLLRRRSGRVVSPIPTQQAAPQNPAFVPVTRGHIRPALRRGDGRTASPVTTQIAAPQNPAFVPVIPKRARRALARAGHTAEAPVEPTQLVQAVASPLRRLVRQIRRRLAQIFPAIGVFPPPDVDVSTGPDRYSATTGADRYSATTGVDRYEASSGVRGFDATTGTDRYSGDVAR